MPFLHGGRPRCRERVGGEMKWVWDLSSSDPRAWGGVQRPGTGVHVLTLPSDPGDPEGVSEEGAGPGGRVSG